MVGNYLLFGAVAARLDHVIWPQVLLQRANKKGGPLPDRLFGIECLVSAVTE